MLAVTDLLDRIWETGLATCFKMSSPSRVSSGPSPVLLNLITVWGDYQRVHTLAGLDDWFYLTNIYLMKSIIIVLN